MMPIPRIRTCIPRTDAIVRWQYKSNGERGDSSVAADPENQFHISAYNRGEWGPATPFVTHRGIRVLSEIRELNMYPKAGQIAVEYSLGGVLLGMYGVSRDLYSVSH